MKRLNKNLSKIIISKETGKARKEFLTINEEFERLLEKCDAVQLDQKDHNNRSKRKYLIKDIQKLLDRNDKAMSFLPK